MNFQPVGAKAPITAAQRKRLQADVNDLYACAKRKGTTMDRWDHANESSAARDHFELGCWLFYYSKRINAQDSLKDRIDCARRMFEAGIYSPGYQFHTAFDFGERVWDSIFEQGDSAYVIEGLREFVNTSANIRKGFEDYGWPIEGAQTCLAL